MNQSEPTYIKVAYPIATDLHFKVTVPMCSLVISPGIGNVWATGKYNDPMDVMRLSVTHSENTAQVTAVGAYAYRTPRKHLPSLALSFGRLRPFSLSISSGDLSDKLDLGGLPLSSLEIQYGTGSQTINFSYPNPQVMNLMKISADTGPVQIEGLANANAAEIQLHGTATVYRLNFSDEPKQNLNLHIGPSVGSVEILTPSGTAVKVKSGTPPISNRSDDFSYTDKIYWNSAARAHAEPLLSIQNPGCALRLKYI